MATKKLSFEVWHGQNEDRINTELSESGATMECDFDPEWEFDMRYQKYLESKEDK